jgi:hypothetical protein
MNPIPTELDILAPPLDAAPPAPSCSLEQCGDGAKVRETAPSAPPPFRGGASGARIGGSDEHKPGSLGELSPRPKRDRNGVGSAGRLPPHRPRETPTARALTATGRVSGETHPCALHSDATVAEARRLAAGGMTHAQVAQALGVPRATCSHWINGSRRPEPVRLIVSPRWRRNATASLVERDRLRRKTAAKAVQP